MSTVLSIIDPCETCKTGFYVRRSDNPAHIQAYIHLRRRPQGWFVTLGIICFICTVLLWVTGIVITFQSDHHAHQMSDTFTVLWLILVGLNVLFSIYWTLIFYNVENMLDDLVRNAAYLAVIGNMTASCTAFAAFLGMCFWQVRVRDTILSVGAMQTLNGFGFFAIFWFTREAYGRADIAKNIIRSAIKNDHILRLLFPSDFYVVVKPAVPVNVKQM